jgi:tetratricopeptide (TPR) repeat protein
MKAQRLLPRLIVSRLTRWVGCSALLCAAVVPLAMAIPANNAWDPLVSKAKEAEDSGQWAVAEQNYQRALELAKAAGKDKSAIRALKVKLACSYVHDEKPGFAESLYSELMQNYPVDVKSTVEADRKYAAWLDDLADAYDAVDSPDTRESCLKHALAIKEKIFGSNDDCLSRVLNDLFYFYNLHQRYAEAEPVLKWRIQILDNEDGADGGVASLQAVGVSSTNGDLPTLIVELGSVQTALRKYESAESSFRRGYPLVLAKFGPRNVITASTARELGFVLMKQNKLVEAKQWAEKAVELRHLGKGEDGTEFARDMYVLARIYEHQGNLEKAEQLYRQTISTVQHVAGAESTELVCPLVSLASLLKRIGKANETKGLERQISQLKAKEAVGTFCPISLDAN